MISNVLLYARYCVIYWKFLAKGNFSFYSQKLLIWGDGRAREMHTENYKMSQTMFRFLHIGLWDMLVEPKGGSIHFGLGKGKEGVNEILGKTLFKKDHIWSTLKNKQNLDHRKKKRTSQ